MSDNEIPLIDSNPLPNSSYIGTEGEKVVGQTSLDIAIESPESTSSKPLSDKELRNRASKCFTNAGVGGAFK